MRRDLEWITNAVDGALVAPDLVSGLQDQQVELRNVTTDSRECVPGSLYIARVGENADGHDYIDSAARNGAVCAIVETPERGLQIPQIVVKESTIALGDLARAHLADLRRSQEISVVGITGSAGKTTTKDLLARVGKAFAPTVAPKLSFNNEVGCPLTVLKADRTTRYLVLEMGASGAGHIAYLTDIAPLDVAVVLMVGRAHLGGFGSEQALASAKAELVEGLLPGGTAVLNQDDPLVWAMRAKVNGEVIGVSANGSPGAQLAAADVELDGAGRPTFVVTTPSNKIPVQMRLVGAHQVSNALAALGAAQAMGLDLYRSARVIESAPPDSPHRMDIQTLPLSAVKGSGEGNFTLLDDSYNANPDSMGAAFAVASELAKGQSRILMVLGEMLELGDGSTAIHREVGDKAMATNPALLIELSEEPIYAPGMSSDTTEVVVAPDPEIAHRLLVNSLREGDVVLIKGSNGSRSWEVADMLTEAASNVDAKDAK